MQILGQDQFKIVRKLGKVSGLINSSKVVHIETDAYRDLAYLPNCVCLIELEFTQLLDVEGDHVLGVAKVISYKHMTSDKPLTLYYLREKRVIS